MISFKIQAIDKIELPDFQIDSDFKTHYTIHAGKTFKLYVLYHGRPTPSVQWTKCDGNIEERAEVQTTSYSTALTIGNTKREDSGKYTITLENSAGEKKMVFTVKILGILWMDC